MVKPLTFSFYDFRGTSDRKGDWLKSREGVKLLVLNRVWNKVTYYKNSHFYGHFNLNVFSAQKNLNGEDNYRL